MVFSISHRTIFASATLPVFPHSRKKIGITQNQEISIHIVITELACYLEHVNCFNILVLQC